MEMTQATFRNALCLLHGIDAGELKGVPTDMARRFCADPVRSFIRSDDATATAIWSAMEARIARAAIARTTDPVP